MINGRFISSILNVGLETRLVEETKEVAVPIIQDLKINDSNSKPNEELKTFTCKENEEEGKEILGQNLINFDFKDQDLEEMEARWLGQKIKPDENTNLVSKLFN